jgi:hypothetical protein
MRFCIARGGAGGSLLMPGMGSDRRLKPFAGGPGRRPAGGQPAPAGITVYGISDPAENYGFDGWVHTWFLQKMAPGSRTWPAAESYWDIYVVPSTNEYTIHQTIIPTAFYWGFLAARP